MKKIALLFVLMFTLVSCNGEQKTTTVSEKTQTEIAETTEIPETENEISGESEETVVQKLQVMTSVIPLASLANYIGDDYIDAVSLVPVGVSPHAFDLKPNQMVALEKSDLILSLGYDHIDGFLDKALEGKNVLVATKGIEMMEASEDHHDHGDKHGEEEGHGGEHDNEHYEDEGHEDEHEEEVHEMDPHVWTSAENALMIAKNIQSTLSELQPQNADSFAKNYTSLEKELLTMKQNFLDSVEGKAQSEFVVFHDAHNYLFHELDIDGSKKLVFRTNVLSDPNSAEMKEIIDEITNHGVKNFYKEPQFSDSNLDKLASEYNLEVDILNPLGTDDSKNGYIENYRINLEALKKIYE